MAAVAPVKKTQQGDAGGYMAGLVDVDRKNGRFRIHRDAYRSREVFEREKTLIFEKCWLYVGHRTEIPNAGDFVTREVGGRNIVFMRDKKNGIGAFFNACTHRGATVCRESRGNSKVFTCPYHGWAFDNSGKLVSTYSSEGYRKDLNDDGRLDLPRVPQLDHYRGFYFLNYNPKAISLADYLAGAKEVIDSYCDQAEKGDEGLYIVGGEHAYSIRANYKYLCENSYDGYHVVPTHMSFLDYLTDRTKGTSDASVVAGTASGFRGRGYAKGIGHGHAVLSSFVPTGRPVAHWIERWGPVVKQQIEANRARLDAKYGKERAEWLSMMQKNCVIFPNLVINDNVGLTIRVIEPMGPNEMHVRAWGLAHAGEPKELLAIRLDNFSNFLGPAGFGSADDIEMLELCQEGIEHAPTEWSEYSKGLDVNCADLRLQEGAPDDECQMQAYWTQWDRVISGLDNFERQ